jgi:hypothetical protein
MSEASAPIDCPSGHSDTVKLFSMVAVGGLASTRTAAGPGPSASGGGCCGGACGCG